ncbi:MAG: SUMF1/EgtB/PvdO family nonheme iron enzyme [Anaerolineae bacterium]
MGARGRDRRPGGGPLGRGRRVRAAAGRGRRTAQLFGDVWEWTRSAYEPYPGYRIAAGALGEYNGKFMAQQIVLRGGSCLTPRGPCARATATSWPPETRFQMAGARLARDA